MFFFEKHVLLNVEVAHILLMTFEFGVEGVNDISKFYFEIFCLKIFSAHCPIFLMKMYVFLSLLLIFTLSFEKLPTKFIYLPLLLGYV